MENLMKHTNILIYNYLLMNGLTKNQVSNQCLKLFRNRDHFLEIYLMFDLMSASIKIKK